MDFPLVYLLCSVLVTFVASQFVPPIEIRHYLFVDVDRRGAAYGTGAKSTSIDPARSDALKCSRVVNNLKMHLHSRCRYPPRLMRL